MLRLLSFLFVFFCAAGFAQAADRQINPQAKSFKYSTTIEKERPELDDETKRLIAAYRKDPTQKNYEALRKKVAENYDEVVARKKAKLEELKQTAKHQSKIDEMQEIVDEMLADRENRINQTMSRFADARMRPGARENKDGYLPVLGAAQNVFIAYTPVTNAEYARFVKDSGHKAPKHWANGSVPEGKENYPVTYVSYADAAAYAAWLGSKEGAVYRLPTEKEWELAAGHMPKDADMNCAEGKGLTPVNAYAQTLSASGAVDMWGNVWEWTSTARTSSSAAKTQAVKGGAWSSARTDCRTENRAESRNPNQGYDTVGFRLVKEK